MRTLASFVAIGAGVYAFTMDRNTRKQWKKRITPMSLSIDQFLPSRGMRKRTIKRMRKQMKNAFS